MEKQNLNIKYLYAGLILMIFVGFLGIARSCFISKNGIYIIGIIDTVTVGRSGVMVHIHYGYNDKKYTVGFKPSWSYDMAIGRKIFIKILPNSPSVFEYTDITVPDCIFNRQAKMQQWNEIPTCP
ncbi:MAG TPA: hypothetical protein VF476_13435 [Chitinophagaceae bacterium]